MARGYLPSGGSGSGSDDVTATAAQVLTGYTAITSESDDEPINGSMADRHGTTQNASAVSEKSDHTKIYMKVGAAGYYDTNSYLQANSSSFGDATAAQVRKGKKFTSSAGLNAVGTMEDLGAYTYHATGSDQSILPVGRYVDQTRTIKGVTTANLTAANIKKGITVKVGDADDDDRITSVVGTYTGVLSDGQTAATAGQIMSGYSAFVNGGAEMKGTIAWKSGSSTAWKNHQAASVVNYPDTGVRMQVPASGYYNTYSYIYAAYSEFGNAGAGDVFTGKTFTSSAGFKATGTMANKGGASQSATVDADTTNSRVRMKIPASGYYNTSSYLYATYGTFGNAGTGSVLSGATFTSSAGFKASGTMANKGGSDGSLSQQSATVDADTTYSRIRMKIPANGYYNGYSYLYSAYSTFGNAGTGDVLKDKTFTSSAGFKAKGTIASHTGGNWYATTSDQTVIPASNYATSAHVLKKLTQTNLATANILRGHTIKINNGSTDVWSVTGSNAVLKRVTGSATLGTTTVSLPNDSGTNYTAYYVDVNPAITPVMIFTLSGSCAMWHNVTANTGNIASPSRWTAVADTHNINGKLPASKTSTRLAGNPSKGTVWYEIYGY